VYENRVLWRIFVPKRKGVTVDWRRLCMVEFHDLYASPNVIRVIKSGRMRCVGHVARMENKRHAYRCLVVGPEGKGPLERPKHRWEYIINSNGSSRSGMRRYGVD
jgi:hypothetical protein